MFMAAVIAQQIIVESDTTELNLENKAEEGLDKAKGYAKGAMEYLGGAAEVIIGVFVCFYGHKMIDFTLLALLFFGVTIGLYMAFQSLNDATGMYAGFKNKEQTAQIIILVVCALIGAGCTYMAKLKLQLDDYVVRIIAFFGAAAGVFLITVGISMPNWAKYALMIVGGVIAIYLVKGNED